MKDKDQDFVNKFGQIVLSLYLNLQKIKSVDVQWMRTNFFIKTLSYNHEGGFHVDTLVPN